RSRPGPSPRRPTIRRKKRPTSSRPVENLGSEMSVFSSNLGRRLSTAATAIGREVGPCRAPWTGRGSPIPQGDSPPFPRRNRQASCAVAAIEDHVGPDRRRSVEGGRRLAHGHVDGPRGDGGGHRAEVPSRDERVGRRGKPETDNGLLGNEGGERPRRRSS